MPTVAPAWPCAPTNYLQPPLMNKTTTQQYLLRSLSVLLIALPIVAGLYLLKRLTETEFISSPDVSIKDAQPIITLPEEHATTLSATEDVTTIAADTLVRDHRPPMEAGDEDGYWDGWADGAEARAQRTPAHLARKTFDPQGNYATATDCATYAEAYREAYEAGFAEAIGL